MKMKKSMLLASVAALVIFSSCRKEKSNTNPGTSLEKSKAIQNELPETSSPVVRAVASTVGSNVTGYYIGLPARYDSTSKNYPLLIFIHGIGQLANGQNALSAVSTVGATHLLNQKTFPASFTVNGKSFSFIVAAPQFKEWPKAADVSDVINAMVEKYRVDASRIYVAGLSMGGGTTWDVASSLGSKVAAIVPISGASYADDKKASSIASNHVAVWAFHNSGDKVVSSDVSKQIVQKINANNPNPAARLTIFESKEHDAWTKATDPNYKENGMNIYEWMLQYSKI